MKMVDKLVYASDVKGEIKRLLGIDADRKINQLTLADMKNLPGADNGKGGEVAVYYA